MAEEIITSTNVETATDHEYLPSIDTSRRRYQREEYNTCKNKQEIIMTHIPFKVSCLFLLLSGLRNATAQEASKTWTLQECLDYAYQNNIQERLWELRKDKGLNLEELSKLTGISKSALGSYEKEDFKEINHGNLITLADFYGVSVDYLLCRTENREQINTPLTELHLNDEMVALLKSGRINNRLLCELATHKDFIKFLADIEIYVDGIATMQIQNLNALVDTVRHEIIERYRPGEDDPHLKVLQAAHISDDEYFSHMVLDDLNLIIRDIREAHKKDSESAPQTTVADELKENLEAVENFKGSRDEKLVVLYCKQLGINYKNLSDEEFRWFIRILKKSKKMGTPINQRKKR